MTSQKEGEGVRHFTMTEHKAEGLNARQRGRGFKKWLFLYDVIYEWSLITNRLISHNYDIFLKFQ